MLTEKNLKKCARLSGMEISGIRFTQFGEKAEKEIIYTGTVEEWKKFDNIVRMLEKQIEDEIEIILENN